MSWLRPSVWMHPLPNFASNLLVREIIEAFLSLSVAMHRRWSSTHGRPRLAIEDTRPDAAPQASGTAKQPSGECRSAIGTAIVFLQREVLSKQVNKSHLLHPYIILVPILCGNMTCINTRDQHILHCNLAIASTQSKYALHEHKKASTQSLVLLLSSNTTTRKKLP